MKQELLQELLDVDSEIVFNTNKLTALQKVYHEENRANAEKLRSYYHKMKQLASEEFPNESVDSSEDISTEFMVIYNMESTLQSVNCIMDLNSLDELVGKLLSENKFRSAVNSFLQVWSYDELLNENILVKKGDVFERIVSYAVEYVKFNEDKLDFSQLSEQDEYLFVLLISYGEETGSAVAKGLLATPVYNEFSSSFVSYIDSFCADDLTQYIKILSSFTQTSLSHLNTLLATLSGYVGNKLYSEVTKLLELDGRLHQRQITQFLAMIQNFLVGTIQSYVLSATDTSANALNGRADQLKLSYELVQRFAKIVQVQLEKFNLQVVEEVDKYDIGGTEPLFTRLFALIRDAYSESELACIEAQTVELVTRQQNVLLALNHVMERSLAVDKEVERNIYAKFLDVVEQEYPRICTVEYYEIATDIDAVFHKMSIHDQGLLEQTDRLATECMATLRDKIFQDISAYVSNEEYFQSLDTVLSATVLEGVEQDTVDSDLERLQFDFNAVYLGISHEIYLDIVQRQLVYLVLASEERVSDSQILNLSSETNRLQDIYSRHLHRATNEEFRMIREVIQLLGCYSRESAWETAVDLDGKVVEGILKVEGIEK